MYINTCISVLLIEVTVNNRIKILSNIANVLTMHAIPLIIYQDFFNHSDLLIQAASYNY
jgi:hypothetical protein